MPRLKKRCAWCGAEFFTYRDASCCNSEHTYEYKTAKSKLKSRINTISKRFNFEVKNADKIINAKIRFFAGGDLTRCPCDADNPHRYCGSAQCISDVVTKGHCHCSLFHKKEEEA